MQIKTSTTNNHLLKIPLLRANGFNKNFGDIKALSGVNLSIFANEIVGIIGPNGSGKTTLLECLCGLQPLHQGEVLWKGVRISPQKYREFMFYVPDGISPYMEHRAGSVLDFFGDAYGLSRKHVGKIVKLLDLETVLEHRVGRLSKGWRRRLLLGIGLITPHPLLIMDEPFDGLDLRQTRTVMSILKDVSSKGRSLLLSIHQLSDAERMCDRFILLTAGSIVGAGTLNELRRQTGKEKGSLEDIFLELS